MNPKLERRIKYALNYVANMTYCGADAEWHFKPNYNPQIILDAIEFLSDPTKLATIKSYAAICPKCAEPVDYDYIKDGGILSSLDYDLIGDSIFHAECWNAIADKIPVY